VIVPSSATWQYSHCTNAPEFKAEALRDKLRQTTAPLRFSEGGKARDYDCSVTLVRIERGAKGASDILRRAFEDNAGSSGQIPPRPAPEAHVKETIPPQPSVNEAATAGQSAGEWQAKIKTALEHNSLELMYQPIINLHGEAREYYETLLYMSDGTDLVPAESFLSGAVESGQARKLDGWLMQQAIDNLSRLHKQGRQAAFHVSLSTNAVSDNLLLSAIKQHLRVTRLAPEYLFIQLDAAALAGRADELEAFIGEIKKMGAGAVLDHFSGDAGASDTLERLAVDFVKIDCPAEGAAAVADAVRAVKALEKAVIVRGVEDPQCLSELWNLSVDYVQGDYLHPISDSPACDLDGEQTLASDELVAPNWTDTA